VTGLADNLLFDFGFAQLGFRAKSEDRRGDYLIAVTAVICPELNVGALGVGIVLNVYQPKQHQSLQSRGHTMREVPALGQVPGLQDGQKLGLVWSIVEDKSLPQRDVEKLVEEAPAKICPYSHATRGNVDVTFEVVGG